MLAVPRWFVQRSCQKDRWPSPGLGPFAGESQMIEPKEWHSSISLRTRESELEVKMAAAMQVPEGFQRVFSG